MTLYSAIEIVLFTALYKSTILHYIMKGAVNCAQRLAVILTSQDVDFQHTVDGPSPALAQKHGTLYLIV